MPQDGFEEPNIDPNDAAFIGAINQQPMQQGRPPMLSEQATSRFYDPITAGLIHDTPSPDEIFRAIRSTPVINPLAIMRGQQIGPEMLPSTILKAQRMSAVKERAQLLALLQDTQAHQLIAARIGNQQDRLAFDMMRQSAAQGNAAVGAVYKTFSDIADKMDPEQANAWLGKIMQQDISQGIPNEAAGRQMALKALMEVGGIKPKTRPTNAPAGFQFTPEGNLEGIPGGPADPNVIRQNAEARHITVNVGGGAGAGAGFFAPGSTTQTSSYRDPNTGELITESTPYGVMRPKGGGQPYAVPLQGVQPSVKSKPLSAQEAGRVQGLQQGAELVDAITQRIFPQGIDKDVDRSVLAGTTAARHGIPAVLGGEQGALVHRDILQSVDPYVRSTTGAALNEQELRNASDMFEPGVGDTSQLARDKLTNLKKFLSGDLSLMGMVLSPGSAAYKGFQSKMSPAYPGATTGPVPQMAPPPGPQAQTPRSAQIPRITSDSDYQSLPSGTVFIDPEGNRRRKP